MDECDLAVGLDDFQLGYDARRCILAPVPFESWINCSGMTTSPPTRISFFFGLPPNEVDPRLGRIAVELSESAFTDPTRRTGCIVFQYLSVK